MRVVAGSAGGRRLEVPSGRGLRPTTDRVREAVFSSIASRGTLERARVVDLFAGTGALGIEALSRGAVAATFVEADHAAAATIKVNLSGTGLSERGTVVRGDVLSYLAERSVSLAPGGRSGPAEPFDIAFADPPYRFALWPALLERLAGALSSADDDGLGIAVLESRGPVEVEPGWMTLKTLRHGDTVVTFARPH